MPLTYKHLSNKLMQCPVIARQVSFRATGLRIHLNANMPFVCLYQTLPEAVLCHMLIQVTTICLFFLFPYPEADLKFPPA